MSWRTPFRNGCKIVSLVMCPAEMPAEITRNLFMTAYPRMVEILQLLGSSSFMIIPSEADFATTAK
jgi:4-hydroxyphenylacetate 3-monooxygenase